MSNSQAAPSHSEADLLEKIRQAELNANASVEEARKEAERIIGEARSQANAAIQQAEEISRKKRDQTLSEGKTMIGSELEKIKGESSREVKAVRDGTGRQPDDLKKLVLSILEV